MRSTLIAAAAFAATALAVPYANPDVVTAYETDVVYVTNVYTVTQGAAPAATTVAAADNNQQGGRPGGWHWPHKHRSKKTKTKTRTRTHAPSPPPSYSTQEPESPPPAYTPEPTTTKTKTKPKPTQAPPSSGDMSSYNGIVVGHHNVHRSNHSAPNLQWDQGLAWAAEAWGAECNYAHDTEKYRPDNWSDGYGQNIAAGVEKGNVSAIITDLFYNGEIGYYGNMYGSEPDMTNFEKWGHFSQIVWKGTKYVGCATVDCSANGLGNVGSTVQPYFTVCNYGPAGNYGGEYADNVLAPQGDATVEWNYGGA